MKRYGTGIHWLAGFAVFVTLTFTASSLYRLQTSLGDIHTSERGRPVWIVSRLEFEYLRFEKSLAEYMVGIIGADDVRLRFDILWSRVGLLQSATTAERLKELTTDVSLVEEIRLLLIASEAAVWALDDTSREKAVPIHADFRRLDEKLRDLTQRSQEASSVLAVGMRQNLVELSGMTVVLSMLAALILLIVAFIFGFDARRHKRMSAENLRLLVKSRAAAEAKTEFISVVNHELRTPLTSVLGALGLMRGGAAGPLDPKARKLVDLAYNNCERLAALISDLLEIDKAEAGKLAFETDVIDMSRLARDAIQANAYYSEKHNVKIVEFELQSGLYADVDRKRILQVMANLLSNAIKFSEPGTDVKVITQSSQGEVLISVRDAGVGIPAEEIDAIFERFYQVDSTAQRKYGGTGLGLSIARGIVEGHGGRLTVESTPGVGSTFTIALPKASLGKNATTEAVQAA